MCQVSGVDPISGEAFIFGKSDWHYVLNTFCFGYKVGYKFVETDTGMYNGIGADARRTAVSVEECARYGNAVKDFSR